jgi:hypothetical protein
MFGDIVHKVTDKISGKEKTPEINFTQEEELEAQRIYKTTDGGEKEKNAAAEKYYSELVAKKRSMAQQPEQEKSSESSLFSKVAPVAKIERIETNPEEPEIGTPESGLQAKIFKFVKEGVKAEYTNKGLRLTYKETVNGKEKQTTAEFGLVYQLSEPLSVLIDEKVGKLKKANNSKMQLVMMAIVAIIVFYAGVTFLLPRMASVVSRADFDTNVGGMADTIAAMQSKLNSNDTTIKQLQDRLNQDEIIIQQMLQ